MSGIKRSGVLALALGLLIFVTGPAGAGGAVAERANGGYHWNIAADDIFGIEVDNRLTVNARKFADGSVSGIFAYEQQFLGNTFRWTTRVTCFNVYDGNRAKIGGVVEVSNDDGVPAGIFAWFQAIDNGEGEGASPDRSTLVGIGDEAANEAFCNSSDPPRFGPWDVTGNLQVDAD